GSGGGSSCGTVRSASFSSSPGIPTGYMRCVGWVDASGMAPSVHLLGRRQSRVEDFRIGPAATQIPAARVLHIVQRRVLVLLQQRRAAHDHPRRAETALHGIMLDELLLNRVQRLAQRETCDCLA